jgi:hypothetical protein
MCTGEAYNKMEDAYFEVVDAVEIPFPRPSIAIRGRC